MFEYGKNKLPPRSLVQYKNFMCHHLTQWVAGRQYNESKLKPNVRVFGSAEKYRSHLFFSFLLRRKIFQNYNQIYLFFDPFMSWRVDTA